MGYGIASRFLFPAVQPVRDDLPHDAGDGDARLARDALRLFPVALDEVKVDPFHVGKANNLSHSCHYTAHSCLHLSNRRVAQRISGVPHPLWFSRVRVLTLRRLFPHPVPKSQPL
jgi:hypothetical protein